MTSFLGRHRSAVVRGASVAAAVLALFFSHARWTTVPDTGARIRFYRARIGGPATYPAYARLGGAYLQKARETGRPDDYDEAERYLEQSIRYQPNFEAARWLAAAYSARHKFQKALPYALDAVSAMPSDVEAQGTLFDAYLGIGDRKNAAAILASMEQDGPSFFSDARLSALRKAERECGPAIQAMERACTTADRGQMPAETRAWCRVELGFLFFQNRDGKRARAEYESALRILPGYHHALKHMADLNPPNRQIALAAPQY